MCVLHQYSVYIFPYYHNNRYRKINTYQLYQLFCVQLLKKETPTLYKHAHFTLCNLNILQWTLINQDSYSVNPDNYSVNPNFGQLL